MGGTVSLEEQWASCTHLYCVILAYMIRIHATLFIHTDATIRSELLLTLIRAEQDRRWELIYLILVYVTPATASVV
jgi:hypothetical protein